MQYKGVELVDIADTQQFADLPRNMLVWNDEYDGKPKARVVCGAVVDSAGNTCFITHKCGCAGVDSYFHCAEFPEEPKKRATYRQLSRWLAQGNGECTLGEKIESKGPFCEASLYYDSAKSNEKCLDEVRIRKWDDTEWHEPTLEYMGLEDK